MPEQAWSEVAAELSAKIDRTNDLLESLLLSFQQANPCTAFDFPSSIRSCLGFRIVEDPHGKTPSSVLYDVYRSYCGEAGFEPVSSKKFGYVLNVLGYTTWKTNNITYKLGLKAAG